MVHHPSLALHALGWVCVRLALFAAILSPAALSGCSDPPPEARAQCQEAFHCPDGLTCQSGRCVPPGCGAGPACTPEQTCTDGGCQGPSAGCRGDDDCPGGRCVDGECFQNECADGDEEVCDNECGQGVRRCRGGVWRPCSAQPTLEICGDNVDNDCDSRVDEGCEGCEEGDERLCETECGEGVERCLGASWQGCTAARVREEICGNGVDDDCDGQIDEGCDGCAAGETRPCETACGRGTETCRAETWQDCNAAQPAEEICDGQDNDCDGRVDEGLVRDCRTACGPGSETCEAGSWRGCTAPEDCACAAEDVDLQVCGECGVRQRRCSDGRWQAWEACDESEAECRPGADEETTCGNCGVDRRLCGAACRWGQWQGCKREGVCVAGDLEQDVCGAGCGTRQRVCSDACQWQEWGACGGVEGTDGCGPGQTEEAPCGNCGTRQRICGNDCRWSDFGPCEREGPCAAGETEDQACGACSVQTRTCTAACQWDAFGPCSGEAQCVPNQRETRPCGRCGTQTRVCNECIWGAWSDCGGEGACEPGDTHRRECGHNNVGQCSMGTQVRTCDGQCRWGNYDECRGAVNPSPEICGDEIDQSCDGTVQRRPDGFEPNDSCATCYMLQEGRPDPNVFLNATMDSVFDRHDYYCFVAEDNFSVPGFSERIQLTLENIPNGNDYDLYLYRSVDECRAARPLASSTVRGSGNENINWAEGLNFDDSGTYVVEVRRFGRPWSCDREYRLTVNGLR